MEKAHKNAYELFNIQLVAKAVIAKKDTLLQLACVAIMKHQVAINPHTQLPTQASPSFEIYESS